MNHTSDTTTDVFCEPQAFVPSTENFLVDLGGVLTILSESIYTAGPEVFIRELMQNGQDAITARQLNEPEFNGAMSIDVVEGDDGSMTIVVEDNGIGLTLDESRRALATIAFSMKKTASATADDSPFVGRFGIGILSGFLVADEITLLSRKAMPDSVPVYWTGHISGTFNARPSNEMAGPGTRVFLRLRPESAKAFSSSDLFDIAQKYGRYLKHPVTFRDRDRTLSVTDEAPLWEHAMDREHLLERGTEIFEESMLSVFPFSSREAAAQGLVFIQSESCHASAESSHVVFIKNMLVTERANDIEPPGAPFLRVLMNSDRLRPNAGRDAVMANDPRLPALRSDIASALKQHLLHLHQTAPEICAGIVIRQYRCLAQLAVKDRIYLELLLDYLPVETTLGSITLGEIFRRHSSIVEYMTDSLEFQRIQSKAMSEGDCVLRVETESAHRLIELVAGATDGTKVRYITSNEYLNRFTSKASSLSLREKLVLDTLATELARENCAGEFYETDDPDEMTRLDMGSEESLDRFLSVTPGEEVATKRLLLNRMHPIVSQMIDGAMALDHLRVWLRLCYHLALLQAREIPTLAETRRFGRALGNIFTTSTLEQS